MIDVRGATIPHPTDRALLPLEFRDEHHPERPVGSFELQMRRALLPLDYLQFPLPDAAYPLRSESDDTDEACTAREWDGGQDAKGRWRREGGIAGTAVAVGPVHLELEPGA